jgi:hypothetical protein
MTNEKELQIRLERMESKIDLILCELGIKNPDDPLYDHTHPIILEYLNLNEKVNRLLEMIRSFASSNSEDEKFLAQFDLRTQIVSRSLNPNKKFNLDDLENIQNNSKETVAIGNTLRMHFKINYVHNKLTENILKDEFPKFELINHSKK